MTWCDSSSKNFTWNAKDHTRDNVWMCVYQIQIMYQFNGRCCQYYQLCVWIVFKPHRRTSTYPIPRKVSEKWTEFDEMKYFVYKVKLNAQNGSKYLPKSEAPRIWQKCMRKSFHRISLFRRECECVRDPHNTRQRSLQCKRIWHKWWPMISSEMSLFLCWRESKNENRIQCKHTIDFGLKCMHAFPCKDSLLLYKPGADRVIGITASARNNTSNNLWSR